MWTLLASIAAALVNVLVGRFFPAHPKVTPEVIAQSQKDRADVLQSQKDARREAEKLRQDIHSGLVDRTGALDRDRVYHRDANQRD